jgi:2-oxoglutarate ferredoxin oxidoreductase subunit beta
MTGGQMAPTSIIGMKTSTTPEGRQVETQGYPFKITEVVATLPGTHYVTRQAVHTPTAVRFFKKSVEKAFKYQMEKKGTCLIEIVSNCPSGWKLTPVQSNKWMEENMFPFYPLGDLKDAGNLVEKKTLPLQSKKEVVQ